ncbi:hypothetical protein GY45DRAFT_1226746, partial [Cubamyces sp. BRFM 1775]
ADVIFRSSDAVDFRLHSALLSLASPVFRQMLEDRLAERTPGPPAKDGTAICYGIIFVPEDSATLASLLRHVYPLTRPSPPSFSALKSLLAAAYKYDIAPLISAARLALLSYLPGEALRVFAVAHRFNLPAIRAAAAKALLRISYQELRHRYVEELEEIPAADYFRLLVYHDQCGQAAATCVLTHALTYSGACSPSKKRNSTCHVFLDERSAEAWAHFRAHSAPRWWLMYVYKLALVVRNRPWGDVTLDRGLWRSALTRAAECECCRVNFLPGFREYAEGLGGDIERAVAKV